MSERNDLKPQRVTLAQYAEQYGWHEAEQLRQSVGLAAIFGNPWAKQFVRGNAEFYGQPGEAI